jgi:hypothetical protein
MKKKLGGANQWQLACHNLDILEDFSSRQVADQLNPLGRIRFVHLQP